MSYGKKKFFLYWVISPVGFDDSYILFSDKKIKNLYEITRGEGQVIEFTPTNYDLSEVFFQAINNGDFIKSLGGKHHPISIKRGTK